MKNECKNENGSGKLEEEEKRKRRKEERRKRKEQGKRKEKRKKKKKKEKEDRTRDWLDTMDNLSRQLELQLHIFVDTLRNQVLERVSGVEQHSILGLEPSWRFHIGVSGW